MSTLRLSAVGLTLRIGLLVVVLANALILARVLKPEGFGQYFLFLRLVAVLAAFADFGLSQSVNAFYGRHKHWRGHIHNLMLQLVPIFSLAAICVGGVALWLAGPRLLPNLPFLLMVMAFAILPLSLYANLWNSMMIGTTQIWRVYLLQLVMCTLSLSLTIIFVVIRGGGVQTAAISYLVVMFVQFAVMLVMGVRMSKDQPAGDSPVNLRRTMVTFGLRAYPGSIGYLLCMRIPVFIINITHGPAAVGIFSVAQQVAEKLLLPVEAIQDVTYEKMSTLSTAVASKAMNLYVRLTWWAMWGIIILAAAFSYLGIVLLLGPAYLPAVGVTYLLFIGAAFAAVSLLMDTFFVNQLHRPGLVSILAWLKFLLALTLCLILIPPFGVKGAAASLATMQIVGASVYIYLYLRVTKSGLQDLLYVRGQDIALLRKQIRSLTIFAPARSTPAKRPTLPSETSY
jgi:O-antigen/teichoic acid export membrane protein